MYSKLVRGAIAPLAFWVVAGAAGAQQPAIRDLPKPTREIDDPFSAIASAREAKGKLLVADPAETQVSIVDFATGAKTRLGQKGGGPGEYTNPTGVFRLAGDTVWVLDMLGGGGGNGRFVAFLPDGNPGTTFPFLSFNGTTGMTLSPPYTVSTRGLLFATALPLKIDSASDASGGGRANIGFGDSVTIARLDPRVLNPPFTTLARIKWFSRGGGMQQQVTGTNLKITTAYGGFTEGDSWAVFNDGRVAIVRGGTYRVDFILADGKPGVSATIPYEHVKLTESDKALEMGAVKKQTKAQVEPMVKKMLPAGWTVEFVVTPPASWPAEYPPVTPTSVRAAPDGRLWVQRFVPDRIGREQWDVIDPAGKLVARWQLPAKTSLVAFGEGGVIYTARKDEDDLSYLQRIALPACTECK